MEHWPLLRQIAAQPPRDLLNTLEQHLAGGKPPAELRLGLKSGRELTGTLLRWHAADGRLALLVGRDLTWLDFTAIDTLTLLGWDGWLAELSGGQVLPAEGDPPTRLALKRQAQQLGALLEPASLHLPWDELPQDDGSARHLEALLRDLSVFWAEARQDEVGQKALAAVHELRIETTPGPAAVHMDHGVCRVLITAGAGVWMAYPGETLRGDLDKNL